MGFLHVYCGPMFSGKTSKLIKKLTRYADSIQHIKDLVPPLLINSTIDDRSSTPVENGDIFSISSHSSHFFQLSSRIEYVSVNKLSNVDVSKYEVIGINEAQFFPDLYETIVKWLDEGKCIYVTGLDGNANKQLFGEIYRLLPIAEKFVKMFAFCHYCLQESSGQTTPGGRRIVQPAEMVKAPFTRKISGSVSETDVGGADKYRPVCRKHWKQPLSV